MHKEILTGNEAIAKAAIECGIHLAAGYPGTPSTEVLETVARHADPIVHVEWSVNEKVAMEVCGSASFTGAWTLATMKQVGLNVAADPFMILSYLGIEGAMVIVVADDPGPHASQSEQDTRMYAKFSNIPIFDPSSPQDAYDMTKEAFKLSNKIKLPVIIRPTTRVCHGSSTVEIDGKNDIIDVNGFEKDPKWVIFPKLAYENHVKLEEKQHEISNMFSKNQFNSIIGTGRYGIATGGISYNYVKEIADNFDNISILKIGNPYPFPEELAKDFIDKVDSILVIEELDPVIEEGLIELSYKHKKVDILGKKTKTVPCAGELSYQTISNLIDSYLGKYDLIALNEVAVTTQEALDLPKRQPTLCAGCPHRASYYTVKQATKGYDCVYNGDIGCYTLGNAKPLDAIDTCLCMGAGITMAQGIHHIQPNVKNIAFIGDSTFFHTGIAGLVNAVYNNANITIIVLDNYTTAMTGHQPHPGIGLSARNESAKKLDIGKIAEACGVKLVRYADPYDVDSSIDVVKEVVDYDGVSMLIFERACVTKLKSSKYYEIDSDLCKNCKICVSKLGCPAIFTKDKPEIDSSLCFGCGVCKAVCKFNAIKEVER